MTALLRLAVIVSVSGHGAGEEAIHGVEIGRVVEDLVDQTPGLTNLARDEASRSDVERGVRGCAGDARCASSRLDRAGADLGIFVLLGLDSDPALLTVQLLDASKHVVADAIVGEVAPKRDRVHEEVRRMAVQLLGANGHPVGGRVRVEVDPPEADVVLVDGRGTIHTALPDRSFVVQAGPYTVRASRAGFDEETRAVEVSVGRESRLSLALKNSKGSLIESPLFWAAAISAAAVIAAGTGALFWANRDRPIDFGTTPAR